MAKTIWKFQLSITNTQNVLMPEGAQILTAQIQNGCDLCLWALVDSTAPKQRREIEIIGTGNFVTDESRRYISTVQGKGLENQSLVWHVFERE